MVQSKSSAGGLIPSGTHSQTWRVSQITGRKGGFSLPVLLFVDVSFIFWEASRLGPSPPTAGMHAAPAQEDFLNKNVVFLAFVALDNHRGDPSVSCRAFSRYVGGFAKSLGVGADRWESQSPLLSPVEPLPFFLENPFFCGELTLLINHKPNPKLNGVCQTSE